MIVKTPHYYKNFKCIASACPDSCCQGWEVDADKESLEYYKTLSGDIRLRIDSVLSHDEFGNTIFTLSKGKRCPFLNCDNLCDMHIAIGGEHTPYTCRTFPRFINDFGAVREMGISLSCPVACDIIWGLSEPLSFDSEQNDLPVQLNEIDAQTYYFLTRAREQAYKILQNRSLPVGERLLSLLDYGEELQNELEDLPQASDDIDFFDVFRNPEVINKEWEQRVDNGRVTAIGDCEQYANIACYFIFRYMMQAVYDYDVLSKIKMAVIGVLACVYFGNDSWAIHLWSKETEHSQYNMDRYKELLKTAKCLSVEQLKQRLK